MRLSPLSEALRCIKGISSLTASHGTSADNERRLRGLLCLPSLSSGSLIIRGPGSNPHSCYSSLWIEVTLSQSKRSTKWPASPSLEQGPNPDGISLHSGAKVSGNACTAFFHMSSPHRAGYVGPWPSHLAFLDFRNKCLRYGQLRLLFAAAEAMGASGDSPLDFTLLFSTVGDDCHRNGYVPVCLAEGGEGIIRTKGQIHRSRAYGKRHSPLAPDRCASVGPALMKYRPSSCRGFLLGSEGPILLGSEGPHSWRPWQRPMRQQAFLA